MNVLYHRLTSLPGLPRYSSQLLCHESPKIFGLRFPVYPRCYLLSAVALFLSVHGLLADSNHESWARNNHPISEELVLNVIHQLTLKETATEDISFAVTVALETRFCNLLGRDDQAHALLYTDKIAPFIFSSKGSDGMWHYQPVAGQENVILGYAPCVASEKSESLVPKGEEKQNNEILVQFETDSENNVCIKLEFPFVVLNEEDLEETNSYYQWSNQDGDWYWFSLSNLASQSDAHYKNVNGEMWINLPSYPSCLGGSRTVEDRNNSFKETPLIQSSTTELTASHHPDSKSSWREWWGQLSTLDKIAVIGSVPALILDCCYPFEYAAWVLSDYLFQVVRILVEQRGFDVLTEPSPKK